MFDNGFFNCVDTEIDSMLNLFTSEIKTFQHLNENVKEIFVEDIPVLMISARKKLFSVQDNLIEDAILLKDDVLLNKQDINKTLFSLMFAVERFQNNILKEAFKSKVLEHINIFSKSITRLEFLSDKIIKFCYGSQGPNCPMNQYFHLYLDIQLCILLVKIKCDNLHNLKKYIGQLMEDLIFVCKTYHETKKQEQSIFICICLKQIWTIVKFIFEKFYFDMKEFWNLLGNQIKNENEEFSIYFIREIAFLKTGYNYVICSTNYALIESNLKKITTQSNILFILRNIDMLVCDIWSESAKIDIFLIIWDHFSKNLNKSTKYTDSIYINCNDLVELLETIENRRQCCDEEFHYFVGMLYCHLKKYPLNWKKFKSRLFSFLSPFKIQGFDEIALFHISVLCMVLLKLNFCDLSPKISSIYENISEEKITKTIINLFIIFAIKHVQDNMDMEQISINMVSILEKLSKTSGSFGLIKEFLLGFEQIIKNSQNTRLHQWCLLTSWLPRYLSICDSEDLQYFIEVFLFLINKIKQDESWSYWENAFICYVYPSLEQVSTHSTCPENIGNLAGQISILSSDALPSIFTHFNSDSVIYNVTSNYICTISSCPIVCRSLKGDQKKIVAQSWVKICFLFLSKSKDITSSVLKLDVIPLELKKNLEFSSDSLVTFIENIGNLVEKSIVKPDLYSKIGEFFETLDSSLSLFLKKSSDENIVTRVYTCVALILIQCGSVLYNRYKSTNSMTRLISCLLLDNNVKLNNSILKAIGKTWHLYFEGLLKLGEGDMSVNRMLKNMISKYLTLFPIDNSPFCQCFLRESTAKSFLENLSLLYFKPPIKESQQSIEMAIKILNNYVESDPSINFLVIVVEKTFLQLCEFYISNIRRVLALNLLVKILKSPKFDQIKKIVLKSLQSFTEQHLAFNSEKYFDLIGELSKENPQIIFFLKDAILNKIKDVERIRGVSYDNNLRTHYDKLNKCLFPH